MLSFNICLFQTIAKPPIQIGCASDSECPTDKACIYTFCLNPCYCGLNTEWGCVSEQDKPLNCGLNAGCIVTQHKPLCFCPPGYSGDPKVECQKCKLLSKA